MQFTVIIATCDRPGRLAKCLDAVAVAIKAHGEADRVIVVDNGITEYKPQMNADERGRRDDRPRITRNGAKGEDITTEYTKTRRKTNEGGRGRGAGPEADATAELQTRSTDSPRTGLQLPTSSSASGRSSGPAIPPPHSASQSLPFVRSVVSLSPADSAALRETSLSPVKSVVTSFAGVTGIAVKHLRTEPRNKAKALNAGIAAAETEWLAFTDDDCLPDTGWLREGERFAAQTGIVVFGGRIVAEMDGTRLPRWLTAGRSGLRPGGPTVIEYSPMYESGLLVGKARAPLGANVFVKGPVFSQYGGYDEDLWRRCGRAALGSEDGELGIRLRKAGVAVGYCHEAVVRHPVYAERARLRDHVRYHYLLGTREALMPDAIPAGRLYLLKETLLCLCGAVKYLIAGDPAGAVFCLQQAATDVGHARSPFLRGA